MNKVIRRYERDNKRYEVYAVFSPGGTVTRQRKYLWTAVLLSWWWKIDDPRYMEIRDRKLDND